MRCGCPNCGEFMVHEESGRFVGCVCPACLYRCTACLGTNSMITKEEIEQLKSGGLNPRVTELEADFDVQLDTEEDDAPHCAQPAENPDQYYMD